MDNINTTQVGIKYGVIGSVLMMILALFLYFIGWDMKPGMNYLSYVFMEVALILGMTYFKNENDGYATFGELFKIGVIMSLVMAIIMILWFLLYIELLRPDFLELIKELQVEKLEKRGMTEEQIKQGLKMSEMWTTKPMMMLMGFFGNLIIGTVLSLINAAAIKKDKPLILNQ